ncbi:hypothetical protein LPN04_10545 [Rugamonas sp. A1-17]|nr:hypothetical protein [Rugamonas sp. A1-17]
MSSKKKAHVPPPHIARTLPSDARIWQALKSSICEFKAGTLIIRAAWNPESVWPEQVDRTYRFGPPAILADDNGAFAFHWIYLGDNTITAAWEAQLCVNDASMPGTFFFKRNAADALLAEMAYATCPESTLGTTRTPFRRAEWLAWICFGELQSCASRKPLNIWSCSGILASPGSSGPRPQN